ncbi:MAG: signal peptidase II [Clostridia bacterium]|nr:signal peptidase II [Clostridia bacterium]
MFQAICIAAIALLTAVDQLTKYVAINTVKVDGPFEFFFGLFQFRYVENTGAAFSSFSENKAVLFLFSGLLLVGVLIVLLGRKIESKFANISLVLVAAGGLGNMIDRVINGYVVDFIEPLFVDFAVYNFADICITVGAFLLIGFEIVDIIRESKKHKMEEEKATEEKANEND